MKHDPSIDVQLMDERLGITRLTEYTQPGRQALRAGKLATVKGKGFGAAEFLILDITISPSGAASVNLVKLARSQREEGGFFSFRPGIVVAKREKRT